jgi:hypothetical protein
MLDWIKILFRKKLVQYVSETFTWALEITKKNNFKNIRVALRVSDKEGWNKEAILTCVSSRY